MNTYFISRKQKKIYYETLLCHQVDLSENALRHLIFSHQLNGCTHFSLLINFSLSYLKYDETSATEMNIAGEERKK